MSDLTPSIVDLANDIQNAANKISQYIKQNSLPPLSYSSEAYPFFPGTGPTNVDVYPRLTPDISDARATLLDSCATLTQLVAGPAEAIYPPVHGHYAGAALQYIYRFRIAYGVPIEGDISYEDLAKKTGVVESQCTRVLKYLMTRYIFRQSRPGHVAHTAVSRLLTMPDAHDGVGYLTEESLLGAAGMANAAEKYAGSQEKNTTPWNLMENTDLPMFEYFEKHPHRMQRFLGAMRLLASSEQYGINHLIDGFDWKGLGKGLLVDVGGSFGHCCSAIAEVAPDLEFVVQDLDKVVAQVQQERAGKPDSSDGRIKFQAHNFFNPQPVKNADIYLLRFICHDYSDKYAAQILSNITSAMGPKSKILVVDSVVPEVGSTSRHVEERLRAMDMEMMLGFNACERDEAGWKKLFEQADPRLEMHNYKSVRGHNHALVELRLKAAN